MKLSLPGQFAARPQRAALASLLAASLLLGGAAFAADDDDDDIVQGPNSVASRLGGASGIAAFINTKVVPVLVASDLAPFFTGLVIPLTESTNQTVQCLALLLDHDLGGPSQKNGTIVTDPAAAPFPTQHKCRSSMTNVHRGMHITDGQFDEFVGIVAQQALSAGVSVEDVNAVGHALNRYRGNITGK